MNKQNRTVSSLAATAAACSLLFSGTALAGAPFLLLDWESTPVIGEFGEDNPNWTTAKSSYKEADMAAFEADRVETHEVKRNLIGIDVEGLD